MKNFYVSFFVAAFLICCAHLLSAQAVRHDRHTDLQFCPVSYDYHPQFVPPRQMAQEKSPGVEFIIDYKGNVPAEAKRAMDEGVLVILSRLFDSPVPINIEISWEDLPARALAGASPTAYYSRFTNSPNPEEIYPVALAEKIARRPLNLPSSPDIAIAVDSTAEWFYWDFDEPMPIGNRFDFITVMLHEILHGMGFLENTVVDSDSLGYARTFTNDRYMIYTDFLYLGSGQKLTNIPDATREMASALQSGNLFFNFISSDKQAKIYAPADYQPGSSISHLDAATYFNTDNSLMTPSVSPGRSVYDPGIALEMMYDMGWDMTYLIHTPPAGVENFNQPQLLFVDVVSDSEFDESSLLFHYSRDSFATEHITEPLVFNPQTGLYEAILPAPGEEAVYSYYFSVENSRNITFTNPGMAPENYFEFRYAIDSEAPVIVHESPEEVKEVEPEIAIEAEITDDYLGIETATVLWSINGTPQEPVLMERQEGFSPGDLTDNYIGTLPLPENIMEGDIIEYQIVAVDKSMNGNTTISPEEGFWTIEVTGVQEGVVTYLNNFEIAATDADFEGNGFSIRQPAGFQDRAIHSEHPYPESGQGNFKNYTFTLNVPIIIQEEYALIQFDEIVLVEIGEPGTQFGDDEFWDYVIVEGQRLGESEWLPFLPGYDSGAKTAWRTALTRREDGRPSLYLPRTIDMTANGNFAPGDVVFIRFRLFSDPFANFWGWAIDNLRIQDPEATPVAEVVDLKHFQVFPNPVAADEVMVSLELEDISVASEIHLYDTYGRRLAAYPIDKRPGQIRQSIPLLDVPPGMYVVSIVSDRRRIASRKLIRR